MNRKLIDCLFRAKFQNLVDLISILSPRPLPVDDIGQILRRGTDALGELHMVHSHVDQPFFDLHAVGRGRIATLHGSASFQA